MFTDGKCSKLILDRLKNRLRANMTFINTTCISEKVGKEYKVYRKTFKRCVEPQKPLKGLKRVLIKTSWIKPLLFEAQTFLQFLQLAWRQNNWILDKTSAGLSLNTQKKSYFFNQKPKKRTTWLFYCPVVECHGLLFKSKTTQINHDRNCGWVFLQQAMIQTFSHLSSYKKVLYRNKLMSPLTFFKPTHWFIFLFLCLFFNEGVKLQPFDYFFPLWLFKTDLDKEETTFSEYGN